MQFGTDGQPILAKKRLRTSLKFPGTSAPAPFEQGSGDGATYAWTPDSLGRGRVVMRTADLVSSTVSAVVYGTPSGAPVDVTGSRSIFMRTRFMTRGGGTGHPIAMIRSNEANGFGLGRFSTATTFNTFMARQASTSLHLRNYVPYFFKDQWHDFGVMLDQQTGDLWSYVGGEPDTVWPAALTPGSVTSLRPEVRISVSSGQNITYGELEMDEFEFEVVW